MEDAALPEQERSHLGSQLTDIVALTIQSANSDVPAADISVKRARLRSVQFWIEAHLGDPSLSLEKVAGANGISLRYLHLLFSGCEMSASEWIWNRRLQLAYDRLASLDGRSITSIAFDHGFNSPNHFSTMFKRKYGMSPRDVARNRQ